LRIPLKERIGCGGFLLLLLKERIGGEREGDFTDNFNKNQVYKSDNLNFISPFYIWQRKLPNSLLFKLLISLSSKIL
jgi:hypothetical protein